MAADKTSTSVAYAFDIEEFKAWSRAQKELWNVEATFLSFENWKLMVLWQRIQTLEANANSRYQMEEQVRQTVMKSMDPSTGRFN